MARDVGQCLLGHTVEDQLRLGVQRGQRVVRVLGDDQPRALSEPLTEHGQRAYQPQIV